MGDYWLQCSTHHLAWKAQCGEHTTNDATVGQHSKGLETLKLHRGGSVIGIVDVVAQSGFLVTQRLCRKVAGNEEEAENLATLHSIDSLVIIAVGLDDTNLLESAEVACELA